MLSLIHVILFLLLSLSNEVVAAESRANYFSVASANPFWRCFLQSSFSCRVLLCLCSVPGLEKGNSAECVQQLQHQRHGTNVLPLGLSPSLDCCTKQLSDIG